MNDDYHAILVYKLDWQMDSTPYSCYVDSWQAIGSTFQAIYADDDAMLDCVGGAPLVMKISVEWMDKAVFDVLEPLEL